MPTITGNPDKPDINPVTDLLRSRRTINFFKPDLIPETIIRDAIEVARWAPNHKLTEPWHFYILGAATSSKVKNLMTEIKSAGQSENVRAGVSKRLDAIPGWLVVTCPVSDDPIRQMEDYAACSCAIQNLMLCLWDSGIGVKWTTGQVIRDERFFKIMEIEQRNTLVVGLFWYGYPEVISAQKRKAVAEITTSMA